MIPTKYVWTARWRDCGDGDVAWGCYISNFSSLEYYEVINAGWANNEQLLGTGDFFKQFDFRSPFIYSERNATELLIEFVEFFKFCYNIIVVEHPGKNGK